MLVLPSLECIDVYHQLFLSTLPFPWTQLSLNLLPVNCCLPFPACLSYPLTLINYEVIVSREGEGEVEPERNMYPLSKLASRAKVIE